MVKPGKAIFLILFLSLCPLAALAQDADSDGLPDSHELLFGCLMPFLADADVDYDQDTLTSLEEFQYSALLNPCAADTDGDGMLDNGEIGLGSNPLSAAIVPSGFDELGTERRITFTTFNDDYPVISWSGSEFGLAWEELASYSHMYFTRVSPGGVNLGPDSHVETETGLYAYYSKPASSQRPALAWTGSEYGIFWHDARTCSYPCGGDLNLFMNRISPRGATMSSDYDVTHNLSHISKSVALAWAGSEYGIAYSTNASGTYEIVFERRSDEGRYRSYAQLTDDPGASEMPTVVHSGEGYGVAWQDNRDGQYEIYFNRVSATGQKMEENVRVSYSPEWDGKASLAWTGSEYGLTWQTYIINKYQIMFARLDPDGNLIGGINPLTSTDYSASSARIIWTGSEFAVTWYDNRTANNDIYLARLLPTGVKVGADLQITTFTSSSTSPVIAFTGTEFGLAWAEYSSGNNNDIYFRRIGWNDGDGDGLSATQESGRRTDPRNWDSDGDGMSDQADCAPLEPDFSATCPCLDLDGDGYFVGCTNYFSPNTKDCDDDDFAVSPDETEIILNGIDEDCSALTPDDPDADADGLPLSEEIIRGTSDAVPDSDFGCELDGAEVNAGRDPFDPTDDQCEPITSSYGSDTRSDPMPLATGNSFAHTQSIYLAEEVGTAGVIESVALDVKTAPGLAMHHFFLRLKHTTTQKFTATDWNQAYTTVYENAAEPVGTTGWRTFKFTTPFSYNGVDNLMVDWGFYYDGYDVNGSVNASTTAYNRTQYLAGLDYQFTSPAEWIGNSPAAVLTNLLPNLRFNFRYRGSDYDGDVMPDLLEAAYPACLQGRTADATADPDGDSLDNLGEYHAVSNPCVADTDGDGMPDNFEFNLGHSCGLNPRVDDAADDPDGDGLSNYTEYLSSTRPCIYTDLVNDPDEDGLVNSAEAIAGTNPADADSDNDGLLDGEEVLAWLTDPLSADTDGDGVGDGVEVLDSRCLDPNRADSDADGLVDGGPAGEDRDGDGVTDATESDACNPDTDGDGHLDGSDCAPRSNRNWDSCATCRDADDDGWWAGCNQYPDGKGPDCDDADVNNYISCAICTDIDGDGRYTGCDGFITILGPDCNDENLNAWTTCGTCKDEDSDGFYKTCDIYFGIMGPDCNDANINVWSHCWDCKDSDADGWYSNCDQYATIAGPDCNDANKNAWNTCAGCRDNDLDSWYGLCNRYIGIQGPDCNDSLPAVNPAQAEIMYNSIDDDCNPATIDDPGDSDGDGLSVYQEIALGSSNDLPDSDFGCEDDGAEYLAGRDPADPTDDDCRVITDINTGTMTMQEWSLPLATNFAVSRSQFIYRAAQINHTGLLYSIALDVTIPPPVSMENFTVRIKPTGLSAFSATNWETGWTTVWQGTLTPGGVGLRTFEFISPFSYDGVSNLMIDFSFRNAGAAAAGAVKASSFAWNPGLYARGDYSIGDPLAWTGASPAGTLSILQPNLKLHFAYNPFTDTDEDGMSDGYEDYYVCVDTLTPDPDGDPDADSLTNLQEYLGASSPCNPDTDGDGYTDDEDCDDYNPNVWASCASCADADEDLYYVGCDAYVTITGVDCDDANPDAWNTCASCMDADADAWWSGCNSYTANPGPDCNDADINVWNTCAACVDTDGDSWHTGCNQYVTISGPDCAQYNANTWNTCATCVDGDADGWFGLCNAYGGINGPDCNDQNRNTWNTCDTCKDGDFDGYYGICNQYYLITGGDCDDANAGAWSACATCRDNDGDGWYGVCDRYTTLLTVSVGGGAGTWLYPLATQNHDSRLQSIYLGSELLYGGTIVGLALDVDTPPGQTMNNFYIRMKATTSTTLSGSWVSPGLVTVYQANETITTTGWRTFAFNITQLEYNPTYNLLLDICFNNTSASTSGLVRYTSAGANRSQAARNNSTYGSPLYWSTPPTPVPSANVPNVRFFLLSPINGPDCNDNDTNAWNTCANCVDTDADGWWLNCNRYSSVSGPDCNNSNPNTWNTCAGCVDVDGDNWYVGCNQYLTISGPDCDNAVAAVYPGQPSPEGPGPRCDSLDNQCPGETGYGQIDEGCPPPDTDGDGLADGLEITIGTDPENPDTDGDWLSDGDEYNTIGTDPLDWDTDSDLLPDGFEQQNISGHPGGNLDPHDGGDGLADYDGDGIDNGHDYWNAGGGLGAGAPAVSGRGIWQPDLPGLPTCGYWGEADGDGFISPTDVSLMVAMIGGFPDYAKVYPDNGETQDLDADTFISPTDRALLAGFIRSEIFVTLGSRPVAVLRVRPADGLNPTAAVGDTVGLTVSLHNTAGLTTAGFPVVFTIDPASTGAATLMGGEAENPDVGRYDLTTARATGGHASITLRLDAPGTVKVNARVRECGSEAFGRYSPEVMLAEPVTITVTP